MPLAIIYSSAKLGINAPLVIVEVHLSGGLPAFNIIGLPGASVRESRDRVRSALINSRFDFPVSRLTVNLAPADLPRRVAALICQLPLVFYSRLGKYQPHP
ncbi:MAG: magnesium chelatase family protein [Zhongshania sp.]|jgi:magnesium chelatase family protein